MRHQDVKPEMRVLYSPVRGGPEFAGTVKFEPWQLGGGTWVTHLKDMDPAYGRYVGQRDKTWVHAAALDCLRRADVTEPHLLPTPGAPSAPVSMERNNRPYLDCPECGVPLIPAHGRGRCDSDGNFIEHREACRCRWCGWVWHDSAEPVRCACGALVKVEVDEDCAYAAIAKAVR